MTATIEFPSWEEMTDLEQAQCTYWDMYKDAHGVRPRGIDTSTWTLADFDKEFEYLGKVIEREETHRLQQEWNAIQDFEARISQLINVGAKDRATALRWIMEGSTCNGDWEFLCYEHGLPYGFFRKETVQ